MMLFVSPHGNNLDPAVYPAFNIYPTIQAVHFSKVDENLGYPHFNLCLYSLPYSFVIVN
jgi:hypothetical protein